jgi:ABC-type phosphonate transport system ATPase subunit
VPRRVEDAVLVSNFDDAPEIHHGHTLADMLDNREKASDPKLLIADEPTTALDVMAQA